MRVTSARAFVLIGCLFFLTGEVWGQNCILTGLNGTTISSSCSQQCRDLKFQIPDISGSSTYTVVNIPYNPYPYVTTGATEDPTLYNDDKYSAIFSLPFPFCFFDSVYRKAIISSNGLVTFDTTYANCFTAAYLVDSTIPHRGFFQCSNEDYPAASIMAGFMDLDPRPGPLDTTFSSPRDRKIEWRVEGTAPCRRFVVSYFHIGAFLRTSCGQNPDSAATFQIVMYESTGLIDVFFQSKFCTPGAVSTQNSILGVQDFSRTRAVAAPGKNATFWTASKEGYRFVPSGGASRFVSSELLAMDLSHIASANSSRSSPGLLDLTFPNICSAAPSTQYIVKTIYSACENPSVQLTSLDTITINSTGSLNATATATNTACGPPSGTITVNVPSNATPPFSYVLDGGAPVTSPAFTHTFINVAQGTRTVVVTDGNNSCSGSISVTVNRTNTLNATVTSTGINACGSGGAIDVTPVNGSAPYNFSLDGASSQSSAGVFTFVNVTAGVHNVVVTDANGCTASVTATITQQAQLVASETHTNISCNGGSSTVTVSATGGTAPYTGTGAFSRTAGTFTFTVTDANGCTATTSATITQPTSLVASETHTNIACNGGSSIVTVSASGGTAPYTGTGTFSRTAGTFTFTVTDSNGCAATTSATITQPTPLVASSSASACVAGTSTVTVSASGGTTPYTGTGIFAKTAGTYTFTVTDANGCTATTQVVVNCAVACNITLSTVVTNVSCNGGSNGAVNLTVNGASGPITFNWSNGATTQNINALTAGTYTVTVTDANGCTASASATVTQPTPLVASETHTNIACNGGSSTVIISATGGTAPYSGTGTFSRTAGTFTFTVTDANGCTATTLATIIQPTEFVASENHTNIACNGGSSTVTISATGGTAPYTGTGTFSRTAGTFTFTVTDVNGCTATTSATIDQPSALTASATSTPVTTIGGSDGTATVTPFSGTSPYTYLWSAGGQTTQTATGLTAGSYTVTVTDSQGCTATASITVGSPGCNLSLSFAKSDASCFGTSNGTATVTASNASGTLSYRWSNGQTTQTATALNAGSYSVTVTDATGCSASGSVTITQPTALTASATSTPVTAIGGSDGTATVTPSGGTSPYTYLWSADGQTTQTATGLVTGSHTVTVTDSQGCTVTVSLIIGSPGCNLSLSFANTDVSCFGSANGTATVTASNASGTLCYRWSNGQTTQTATALNAGSYSVTVTDGTACSASGSVTITQPNQLRASQTHTNIACNGGTSTVTITASGGTAPYTGTGIFTRAAGSFNFIVTDNNGCTTSVTTTIAQPTPLAASLVATNATCDARNNGTITVTANGGSGSYQYSLDGIQFQTSNTFHVAPGNYLVTVKDGLECMTTFNSTVGLDNDLRVTVLPRDTTSFTGDKFQLTANSVATMYTWFPATGLSDPKVRNPIVDVGAASEDVTYRVEASTPEGCKGEGYVRIKAFKGSDIYVPTGFTPNHDGKNDKFTPIPVGIKKINYFRVFNRWGQVVFSSTTLNEGWDGKLGAVEQPSGVYVWMVQAVTSNDKVISKTGTVVLIR